MVEQDLLPSNGEQSNEAQQWLLAKAVLILLCYNMMECSCFIDLHVAISFPNKSIEETIFFSIVYS